jgi:hypothetical protein
MWHQKPHRSLPMFIVCETTANQYVLNSNLIPPIHPNHAQIPIIFISPYTYAHSTPPSLAHDSQPHNLGPSSNPIMHSMQYHTEPIDSLSICTCIPCNHHAVLSCTSPWGDKLVAGWWWSDARYG